MTDEFTQFARDLREHVDGALDRLLPPASAAPARLHEAVRYSVFAGGKRVRPVLVVLAGETFGAPRDACLIGGAALEMAHTFSLVHDVLPSLDNDDLRRGQPTVHRQFDEATAVLVGDALLNLGLQTLMEEPAAMAADRRLRASVLVAEAIGTHGMIGGQMADLEAEREWPAAPEAALDSIHERKTGALLTAALRVGGAYAGVRRAEDALLLTLGRCVGMLFQIGDDILDVEGESAILGKTAGKDHDARKLTYPSLHGVDGSRTILAQVRDEAMTLIEELPSSRRLFRSLVDYLCNRDR